MYHFEVVEGGIARYHRMPCNKIIAIREKGNTSVEYGPFDENEFQLVRALLLSLGIDVLQDAQCLCSTSERQVKG